MTALRQIRWTAIGLLFVGLGLAYSSRLIEHEAVASSEVHFGYAAAVMAGKMFTVASILILIWATEWQRAKTAARISQVEKELADLKQRAVAA